MSLRDGLATLTELNAAVVGVSRDDAATQRKFAEAQRLPYPLIPDVDGALGKTLGVMSVAGYYERVTILVSPDGRVAHVFDKVEVRSHAEQVARVIRGR